MDSVHALPENQHPLTAEVDSGGLELCVRKHWRTLTEANSRHEKATLSSRSHEPVRHIAVGTRKTEYARTKSKLSWRHAVPGKNSLAGVLPRAPGAEGPKCKITWIRIRYRTCCAHWPFTTSAACSRARATLELRRPPPAGPLERHRPPPPRRRPWSSQRCPAAVDSRGPHSAARPPSCPFEHRGYRPAHRPSRRRPRCRCSSATDDWVASGSPLFLILATIPFASTAVSTAPAPQPTSHPSFAVPKSNAPAGLRLPPPQSTIYCPQSPMLVDY